MDKAFKVGVLVGILAIAIALFQNSQNGRYQYSTSGNQGVVVDTRTGEFWSDDGSHFKPRTREITAHHPLVTDETGHDDQTQKFRDCLQANIQAAPNHTAKRDCVAEQNFPQPAAPSAPSTSHQ